jgi:hypothetical protein
MPRDDREQEQIKAILDLVERCDQADLALEVRGDASAVKGLAPAHQWST